VEDVVVGKGKLAGKGLYAARDFMVGDVVVTYQLRPLTRAEFDALPDGDDLFVHSYRGRRWLYPAPARWVNHAADPSCYQDFERAADIALRAISAGEAITIDATQETDHELATFLDAYLDAQARSAIDDLRQLVDVDAVLWLSGQGHRGREAVVAALAEMESLPSGQPEWIVGTGRWEAACSLQLHGTDGSDGHATFIVKVIAGNWQVIYQHQT
jgi:hypothetical protein